MNKWLVLGGAIASEVTATLSLKGALTHPWLYAVVVIGYITAFTCLGKVLQMGMNLGIAYGVWGALGVASTAVLSSLIFGEPFTVLMGLGIALIIGGVLTIEIGSHTAHQEV